MRAEVERMRVGVTKEIKPDEGRVALTRSVVRELTRRDHNVLVERDAGVLARYPDSDYRGVGAHTVSRNEVWQASDLVVKVKEPLESELPLIRQDSALFCYLHLAAAPALSRALCDIGCTAIAFETVEDSKGRLPLLEPMSEVAGRLGGLWGAFLLQRTQGGVGILPGGLPGVRRANCACARRGHRWATRRRRGPRDGR